MIQEYDLPKKNPNKRDIDPVDETLIQRLEKKQKTGLQKKGLSPDQIKHWKKWAFDASQSSDKAAFQAINNVLVNENRKLTKELTALDTQFEKKQHLFNHTTDQNRRATLRNELLGIRNDWVECKTKILLNRYRAKFCHHFHPVNNIKALQKRNENEYYAYVENEEGIEITQRVDPKFIREKLDPLYLKYLDEHHEQKGWICFDKNDVLDKIEVHPNYKKIQNDIQPSYQYPINGKGDVILYIRVNFVLKINPLIHTNAKYEYEPSTLKFYYKTSRSPRYCQFTSSLDVDELLPGTILINGEEFVYSMALLHYALTNARIENKRLGLNDKRILDKSDYEFKKEHQGRDGKLQMYHTNVRTNNFIITLHHQISRIRYNKFKDEWEGVQLEENNQLTLTKLSTQWVKKNFTKYWRTFQNIGIEGCQKFLSVPVGDVIEVKPTMDISKNPIVKYQQEKEDICVFASLASVLIHYGLVMESDIVFNLRKEYKHVFRNNPSKFIQSVIDILYKDKRFRAFRKGYQFVKLPKNYDIFADTFKEGEFVLVVIKSEDNQMSHAVCIDNKYIFDSNTSKCLPRSIEGINCCCGDNHYYVGVLFGYHFQLRTKS
jgi:hypothetical protein